MSEKRNIMHSVLAKLMAALMMINLLQGMALTPIVAETLPNVENPQSYVEGSGRNEGIKIKKTVTQYDQESGNLDLQLEVLSDSTETTVNSVDVVLLIDTSGTMGLDGRLRTAKVAAKAAIDKLIPESGKGNIQVGLVEFESDAYEKHKLSKDVDSLKAAVDNLVDFGSTYMQDGLKKAKRVLDEGNADRKIIIVISDGEPTYAYGEYPDFSRRELTNEDTPKEEYEIWHGQDNGTEVQWIGKGYNSTYTNYYVRLRTGKFGNGTGTGNALDELLFPLTKAFTVDEAERIRQENVGIYSVGIGLDGNQKAIDVLKAISSDHNYMDAGNVAQRLETVLKDLVGTLIVSHKIVNGTLTDPMSPQVEYVGSLTITGELLGSNPSQEEQNSLNAKIAAIVRKVEDGTIRLSNITLGKNEKLIVSYKAKVKPEAADGKWYETNQPTTLVAGSNAAAMNFVIPKIKTKKDRTNLMDIPVTKKWLDDGQNRPAEVSFTLMSNPEEALNGVQTRYTLKAAENWTMTIADLPKYYNGEQVCYQITEDQVEAVANYISQVDEENPGSECNPAFTITNTLADEVTVAKKWVNTPDNLKTYVLFRVYGVTAAGEREAVAEDQIEPNAPQGKKVLKVKKYHTNGNMFIRYEVRESVPDYSRLVTDVEEGEEVSLMDFEGNHHTYQVSYQEDQALKVLTITNTNVDTVELFAKKIWRRSPADPVPQDGAKVRVKGAKNGVSIDGVDFPGEWVAIADDQAHSLGFFPEYQNGVKVEYEIEEAAMEDYRQVGVEEEEENPENQGNPEEDGCPKKIRADFVLINSKLQAEAERYQVKKNWVGSPAGEARFGLYEVEPAGTLKQVDVLTLLPGSNWEGRFAAQPIYNKAGDKVRYIVKELDKDGNIAENGDIISLNGGVYKTEVEVTAENQFVFTNTNQYKPQPVVPVVPAEPQNPYVPTPSTPVTPTPVTPAPVTPTPVTPTPVTPTPVTPTPVAPAPVTPAPSNETEVPSEPTPEGAPETVVDEQKIPQGAPELPKTGGMGAGFFGILGVGLAGLGLLFKKRK